jgi:adenosylcobyric acid synthase
LLQPGLDYLEKHTSRPVIGVVPYYRHIRIPEEDSIDLGEEDKSGQAGESLDIAVIHLPRLSNSTDFEPLQQEAGVRVRYVRTADELGEPDAVILPGTKSTVADLEFLRRSGIAEMIIRQANNGTPTIGICGGFQMMGQRIKDPGGVESAKDDIAGLGLLDVVTAFEPEKTTRQVKARVLDNEGLLAGLSGQEVTGYEIHMGQTPGSTRPLFRVTGDREGQAEYIDGVAAPGGVIFGSYLHGLFDNSNFRHALLSGLRRRKGLPEIPESSAVNQEEQFDALAEIVRHNLNMALVNKICGL